MKRSRSKNPILAFAMVGFLAFRGICSGDTIPPKILARLGSSEFSERQAAEIALLKWGNGAFGKRAKLLLEEYYENQDPEISERCYSVLRQLVSDDYLKNGEGYLGISLEEVEIIAPGDAKSRRSVRVTWIGLGSPAASSKLLEIDDLILGLNDEIWRTPGMSADFTERIRKSKPGSVVVLKVLRNGKILDLGLVLGVRPDLSRRIDENGSPIDPMAAFRGDQEAYFRRWLADHEVRD